MCLKSPSHTCDAQARFRLIEFGLSQSSLILIGQSISRLVSQSRDWSVNLEIGLSISRLVSESRDWSVNLEIGQSISILHFHRRNSIRNSGFVFRFSTLM
jgi:hypothetical protein